jgi:hypothetical protein
MIEMNRLLELNLTSSSICKIFQCSYARTSQSYWIFRRLKRVDGSVVQYCVPSLKYKYGIFLSLYNWCGDNRCFETISGENPIGILAWSFQELPFPWTKWSDGFAAIGINTLVQKPFLPRINIDQSQELLHLVFVVSTVPRYINKLMLPQEAQVSLTEKRYAKYSLDFWVLLIILTLEQCAKCYTINVTCIKI